MLTQALSTQIPECEADSTAISLPRGAGVGWGVSEVMEGFVTTLAML
jgi:hypothetical protein